jgi:hypothetical protein
MPITLDGSLGITTPSYGGTDTSEYLVPVTAFKNRIINGAMMIDQRNAGASVSIIGSPYTLDRWKAQTLSAGSVQQITSTISGYANSLKYTSGASNSFMQMGQQIEFNNCYDLQNQTIAISFTIKANNSNAGSTGLTVRTRTVAGINGAAIFAGSNADTAITISTTTATYTVIRTLPATFGALSLEFVLGSHVSGDGFELTGVQLEKGSTATSFDYRPYGTELSLCQRYYYKNFPNATDRPFGVGQAYSTTRIVLMTPLKSSMRIAPTALEQSGTAAHYGALSSIGVGLSCNAVPTFYSASTENAAVVLPFASGLIAGNASFVYAFASGAYFAWSAEL